MAQQPQQPRRVARQMQDNAQSRMEAAGGGAAQVLEQAAQRLQDIGMESYRYVQGAMELNVNAMNRLVGCRSIGEMAEVQRDYFKDAIDHAFALSHRMYGMTAEMAEETRGTLTATLQEVGDEAKDSGKRHA